MATEKHVQDTTQKMKKMKKTKKQKGKPERNMNETVTEASELASNPKDKTSKKEKWLKKKEKFMEKRRKQKMEKRKKQKMEKRKKSQKGKEVSPQNVIDLNAELFSNTEFSQMFMVPSTKEKEKRKLSKDEDSGKTKKRRLEQPLQDDNGEEMASQNWQVKNPEAMSGWQNLCVPEPVLAALEELGFTAPTPIQALALTAAIKHRLDVIGAAQTGSGKTLAFGIPILHHILNLRERLAARAAASEDEDSVEEEEGADSDEGVDEEDDNSEKEDEDESGQEGTGSGDEEVEDMDDDEEEDESGDDPPPEDDCLENFQLLEPESSLPSDEERPLVALVLEPTRELAIQVRNHLQAAAKYTGIQMAAVVGGMAPQKQRRLLKRCPEIIIATPGRLWELLQEGNPHLEKVTAVEQLVIDEADRMVEKGHFQELSQLLELINRSKRAQHRQTYLFSATLATVHSGPSRMLKKKKKKKIVDKESKLEALVSQIRMREKRRVIDLTPKTGTADTLTETRLNCNLQEKDYFLYYLLKQHPGRTLVFANSKDCVRRLVSLLTLLQLSPLPLHADMHQRQRLKNLERFAGNSRGILLASDVAARGLDIPKVDHVIHFQVPLVENYIHRSGRTARANEEGLSVLLVGPEDLRNYRHIIAHCKKGEDLQMFPIDHQVLSRLTPHVKLARQIDTQEHRFSKKKRKNDWFQKAAQDMDLELDEELLQDLGSSSEQQRHQARMRQLRMELDLLLKRQGHFTKYPTQLGVLEKDKGPMSALSAFKASKGEVKKKTKKGNCV